jgi:hypothetical protein
LRALLQVESRLAVLISLVLVLSRPTKPRAVIVIRSGVGVRNVARR